MLQVDSHDLPEQGVLLGAVEQSGQERIVPPLGQTGPRQQTEGQGLQGPHRSGAVGPAPP